MEYASKIQDISSRLDKLEAKLQEEEQEIIYPENPIPQEE